MTLRQISEKIRDHLTKQAQKSISLKTGSCKYRSEDGCMCAVGALISDAAYEPFLEGKVAIDRAVLDALTKSGVDLKTDPEGAQELIISWQRYHDRSSGEFSYKEWLQGDESQSPAAFHSDIIGE